MDSIVLILPILGGGTTRHAVEMFEAYQKYGYNVILIEYIGAIYFITTHIDKHRAYILCSEREKTFFEELFSKLSTKLIHFHHLLGAESALIEFIKSTDITLAITLHDYFTVCPSIKLTSNNISYCGERGLQDCEKCWRDNHAFDTAYSNIAEWRSFYHDILKYFTYIFVPSVDTQKRIKKYYKNLDIKVFENPECMAEIEKHSSRHTTEQSHTNTRIGIIGTLIPAKGALIVLDVARRMQQEHTEIEFILFGELCIDSSYKITTNLTVLGAYDEQEVFSLITSKNINFFWFPNQWPETYCYTLSIPVILGIPVIGGDIGAIGDRIRANKYGKTYKWDASAEEITDILYRFSQQEEHFCTNTITNTKFPLPNGLYHSTNITESTSVENTTQIEAMILSNTQNTRNKLVNLKHLTIGEFKFIFCTIPTFCAKMRALTHIDINVLGKYYSKHGILESIAKLLDFLRKSC